MYMRIHSYELKVIIIYIINEALSCKTLWHLCKLFSLYHISSIRCHPRIVAASFTHLGYIVFTGSSICGTQKMESRPIHTTVLLLKIRHENNNIAWASPNF